MTSDQRNRAKSHRGRVSRCEPEVFRVGRSLSDLPGRGCDSGGKCGRQDITKIPTCFLSEEREFRHVLSVIEST